MAKRAVTKDQVEWQVHASGNRTGVSIDLSGFSSTGGLAAAVIHAVEVVIDAVRPSSDVPAVDDEFEKAKALVKKKS